LCYANYAGSEFDVKPPVKIEEDDSFWYDEDESDEDEDDDED